MVSAPAKGSVLIIDVHCVHRWAIRASFTEIGLRVDEAEDGETAIARFERPRTTW